VEHLYKFFVVLNVAGGFPGSLIRVVVVANPFDEVFDPSTSLAAVQHSSNFVFWFARDFDGQRRILSAFGNRIFCYWF
jgi:hypothetical protein